MAQVLTIGILALPLASAGLLALARSIHPRRVRAFAMAVAGATAVGTIALFPHADSGAVLKLRWLPGTGIMELGLGSTGLCAAAVIAFLLFFALLGSLSHEPGLHPASVSIMFIALASTIVALLSEHFLLRYVALELVALCIAFAPLVRLNGQPSYGYAWQTYLLFRVGDAGLLAAILALWSAVGTLLIKASLAAAARAEVSTLAWIVAGLTGAIWVKLGLWPFHSWIRHGRRLGLAQEAWLYATVMPTLGLYLLYRVTPLLALPGLVQSAVHWLGSAAAVLAALVLFRDEEPGEGIPLLNAGLGGIVLSATVAGVKSAAWIALVVVAPLRLLLFLAADAAGSRTPESRRVAAGFFGLGGLALVAFGGLITWWAQASGAPSYPLLMAQTALVLSIVWVVATTKQLAQRSPSVQDRTVHWTQRVAMIALTTMTVGSIVGIHPLLETLSEIAHMEALALPSVSAFLRHLIMTPALWLGLAAAVVARRVLRPTAKAAAGTASERDGEAYTLEEGLARAAQALRGVVETGTLERILSLSVQTVLEAARLAHDAVESSSLERTAALSARAITGSARIAYEVMERGTLERIVGMLVRAVARGASFAYHVIETEGLEGLLRRSVRGALALARALQRAHTGRLRYNLFWASVSLVLATLGFILFTW